MTDILRFNAPVDRTLKHMEFSTEFSEAFELFRDNIYTLAANRLELQSKKEEDGITHDDWMTYADAFSVRSHAIKQSLTNLQACSDFRENMNRINGMTALIMRVDYKSPTLEDFPWQASFGEVINRLAHNIERHAKDLNTSPARPAKAHDLSADSLKEAVTSAFTPIPVG